MLATIIPVVDGSDSVVGSHSDFGDKFKMSSSDELSVQYVSSKRDGEQARGDFLHILHPARNLVTASRGRNAYDSVI